MEWLEREAAQREKREKGKLPSIPKLSPSMMKLLFDCESCLWHHARGYRRPSFPVAGIALGVDSKAKAVCALYREAGTTPPMLREGSLEGTLFPKDPPSISCRDEKRGCILIGKLDDVLVEPDGRLAPLDHKSCSKPPPTVIPGVQLQLDIYAYLLKEWSGEDVSDSGYLLYHYPTLESAGAGVAVHSMVFASHLRKVPVDRLHAEAVIDQVLAVIRGPKPSRNPDCDFCQWGELTKL